MAISGEHPGPSLPRDSDEIPISSSSSGAQRDQEEPIVIAPSDPPYTENDIISDDDVVRYMELLSSQAERLAIHFSLLQLNDAGLQELNERHALYRIRAHKLSKGESRDKLDDATLRKEYPPERLEMELYFKHYEEDDTIDWYFDRRYSRFARLG